MRARTVNRQPFIFSSGVARYILRVARPNDRHISGAVRGNSPRYGIAAGSVKCEIIHGRPRASGIGTPADNPVVGGGTVAERRPSYWAGDVNSSRRAGAVDDRYAVGIRTCGGAE